MAVEDQVVDHNHSSAEQTAMMKRAQHQQQQQHVVLIHGICGGAWCWYKIKPLLEMSGYTVTCLDLKSAGIDPTHADSVLTFEDYNQPLDNLMESLPEGDKVVLVGHSAGGLSVTWATQKYPNKVQGAIYLAATMLQYGFHNLNHLKIGTPDLSQLGDIFNYTYALGTEQPPTSAIFKQHYLRTLVYPFSPLEDYTLAAMLSRPGPLLALITAKFDQPQEQQQLPSLLSPPRVYIKTKHDQMILKWQQEAMVENWKPTAVYDIDSDHTPFLSTPLLLFGLILKSANLFAASCNHKPEADFD